MQTRVSLLCCVAISYIMFIKKFKLLSWNVQGLGNDEKCNVVRNVIRKARCDVLALQETKCNSIDSFYVSRFLPYFFNRDVVYNLADNSTGGIIIAWTHAFTMTSAWATRHTVSVRLRHVSTGKLFVVTNVYGPTDDSLK